MNNSSVSLTCHFVSGGRQPFLHPAERASSCAKTGRRGIFKTDYYRGRAPRMTEKTYRQVDRLLKLAEQHYVIK